MNGGRDKPPGGGIPSEWLVLGAVIAVVAIWGLSQLPDAIKWLVTPPAPAKKTSATERRW